MSAPHPPTLDDRLPPDVRLGRRRWSPSQRDTWRTLLSAEEQTRLDGYGVEKRRREFLLGRVAARTLLSDVLRCPAADVPLSVATSGAVEVESESPLRLSISHDGDEAAAAVAPRPVGVDLEGVAPRLDQPDRMARFLLAENERPLLDDLPVAHAAAFALCWALKESVLKALHCGLRRSPKVLHLARVDAERGTARVEAREKGRTFEAAFERRESTWLAVTYEIAAPPRRPSP